MGNVITIKHGSTAPTSSVLQANELGFDTSAGALYIGTGSGVIKIGPTASPPSATTSIYGITKLSNSVNSTSQSLAATPSAVKAAYDLASSASTAAASAQSSATSAYGLASDAYDYADGAQTTANAAQSSANIALKNGVWYCTCTTAAATSEKTVNVANNSASFPSLTNGLQIRVRFSYQNTASDPTLNVNSLGAKAIKLNSTDTMPSYGWRGGEMVGFTYYSNTWYQDNGLIGNENAYGTLRLTSDITSTESVGKAISPAFISNKFKYSSTEPTSPTTGMIWLKPI